MLRINIILVFCIIALCTAATTPKPKSTTKAKDVKEKRDAAVSSGGPYSYDAPQKSFQIPVHSQQHQKAAQIEYHQAPQKVAPLEFYQQKQQAPIHVQPQQQQYHEVAPQYVQAPQQYHESAQQYHESAPQYPSSFGLPTAVESLFGGQAQKGYEYSFSYPGFESFNHMPIVHYNPDSNKINSQYVSLPGYKSPSYTSYKTSPYQQSPFSYGSPAPAYSFPSHSYAAPQQSHNSYIQSYAPSAPTGPASPLHSYGFSQSPSEIFVPQTISIAPKPTKLPDYATGTKGLGHYSTISSLSSAAPTHSSYEGPSYSQYTQTERPFKASAYLGSQHGDTHSEQSIVNIKPSGAYLPPNKNYLPPTKSYLPPSKTYLPAKEQYAPAKEHYAPEHYPQVEYQIQYVQAPQKNSYIPPVANSYLPPKSQPEPPKSSYLPPPPKVSYLPPPPKGSYLPPPPKNSYLPPSAPTNSYLPPNNPYHSQSAPSQYQHLQYQQQDSYESAEYQSGHK